MVNGSSVSKKGVVEVIQKFNIQVNNLTQFLPQDRVCEFAKLTPVQLLEETEKAVGGGDAHRELVEKSFELKQLERAVEKNGETLTQLKALVDEQEKDVERVKQRGFLLKKVDLMKKKLPWVKYDAKKLEYMAAKKKMKEAAKQLDEAGRNLNNAKEPIEKLKKEKAEIESKRKKVKSQMDANANKRSELLEKENEAEARVVATYKELEEFKKQEQHCQRRILKASEDLAATEQELVNLSLYEQPVAKLEELKSQATELHQDVNLKKHQKADNERLLSQKRYTLRQCVGKLKDMENANNKLLNALYHSGAEKIHEAYQWVKQNRREFKKDVYGPVLVEVNVLNRENACYLEGHVPYYVWKSFVTQDPEDRDLLVRNLKRFDVAVLNFVSDEEENDNQTASFRISDRMRSLGIHSRLDQVFDAPDAVKKVLSSQFGLDDSYIGSKITDERAEEVFKMGVSDFWTPENHYRWASSRYGGHSSARVDSVDQSRLLLCGVDVGELEKLRSRKEELEDSVSSMEEITRVSKQSRDSWKEAAKLHKEREEIINVSHLEKKRRREVESLYQQRKRKLDTLKQEEDVDALVAKLIEKASRANVNRYIYAMNLKKLLVESADYKWSYVVYHMACIELEKKIRESETNLKQYEKMAEKTSLKAEYCKEEVEEKQLQLAVAKRDAEAVAIITPELEKEFMEMPNTLEELEAAIQDSISQANSILFVNQNLLQEYEHRLTQIETISTKLEADERDLSRCLKEIDSLKEKWLPTLRRLVGKINETFSHNFEEMAVAGEVTLDERDTDFDQYGIHIKVKFRESGQLQALSSHHQSGGERSVSTILYLVSLQDLTDCPFRVVDEINQGMDPINERKMFQQLVRAASQPNTPQCFLLTPKLLPELEYSEECSILNIMNGPWIEQPSQVWSVGDSWGNLMRRTV